MAMDAKKLFKIAAAVVGTIFLGALGSGLWETIISPFLDYSSRISVDLASSIYSGYLDFVYRKASRELTDLYMQVLGGFIVLLFGSYIVVVSTKDRSSVSILLEDIKPSMAMLGGIIVLVAIFTMQSTNYARQIKFYSYHSMEILRPFVGESAYYHLRSQYFRIEGANSFNEFNSKLIAFSKQHSVELPKFEPIE